MRLFAAQPLKVHYKVWSGFIAWLLKKVLHYRRDIAVINVARSFPEKKYGEIKKIVDKNCDLMADYAVEAIWFGGCSKQGKKLRKENYCTVTNPALLNEIYNEAPSVVLLNSHRGNWETCGGIMHYFPEDEPAAFSEDKFTVVYKKLTSKFWDGIFCENRCAAIAKENMASCCVESMNILRFAISHRREKRVYMFPTDQHPYSYSKVHDLGTFMSQPTKTMAGGAYLAQKLHMAVVYMNTDVDSRGHYKVTYTEICRDASKVSAEFIMDEYYKLLERDIRRQPWNYLWTHKRWK